MVSEKELFPILLLYRWWCLLLYDNFTLRYNVSSFWTILIVKKIWGTLFLILIFWPVRGEINNIVKNEDLYFGPSVYSSDEKLANLPCGLGIGLKNWFVEVGWYWYSFKMHIDTFLLDRLGQSYIFPENPRTTHHCILNKGFIHRIDVQD